MRNVKVDRDDSLDLHAQVAAEIRRAISDGEAKPGERLPPAKDLAAVLGVNTNTVLRALRELRDEGLLEFRRGRGITVTGTPQRGAVVAQVKELVSFARQHGYRIDELVEIIESVGCLRMPTGRAPACRVSAVSCRRGSNRRNRARSRRGLVAAHVEPERRVDVGHQ
jgi:GntR family transcriptional regulator